MSLYIYMTHIHFSFVSLAVSQNTVIRFLFIAAVSCAVSFLIVRIQNRKVQKKG